MNRKELSGYIGVDIGGESTRVGTYLSGGQLKVISFPTQGEFDRECDGIAGVVERLSPGGVKVIAVGSPGPLDWRTGKIYKTPNLPWKNVTFKRLERRLGCKVLLDNDANVAGLAEATLGAGRGKQFVAGFTLGTGIGHFQIKQGRIYHGWLDVEAGHQILDPNGPKCNCGQQGCLEAFVSATGIRRLYGVPPDKLDDEKAWEEIARRLAHGLVNTALHVSPQVLILCGGMLARGEMLFKPLQSWYHRLLKHYPPKFIPPVVPAKLGDKAGVVGAIVLAKVGQEGKG